MIEDLSQWTPRARPTNALMEGRYVDVVAWNRQKHGHQLWDAFGGAATNDLLFHFGWQTMHQWQDLADILDGFNQSGEFVTCIFADKSTGAPQAMASYLRIDTDNGVVETGAIAHSPAIAKTRAATESHYLMAKRVFEELGYRRYEWKLNNPNLASHRAAQRFGFTFEGIFRQHQVKPYGNRDTAWYSMLDSEWPQIAHAFTGWLDPANFDTTGSQIKTLESIRQNA